MGGAPGPVVAALSTGATGGAKLSTRLDVVTDLGRLDPVRRAACGSSSGEGGQD